jgi:pimeloyl-ACP methyl ester carboxylesterase
MERKTAMELFQTTCVHLATGVELHIYQAGQGRDLLLLHGLTSAALCWSRLVRDLVGAGYRVTAVDGRGHGLSERSADYSLAAIAADAAALIQTVGLWKPTVIGHSMGGAQALRLVSDHPELVTSVIVEDPAIWEHAQSEAVIAASLIPWRTALARCATGSVAELSAEKLRASPHWSAEAAALWATAQRQVDPDTLSYCDSNIQSVWEWLRPVQVPITVIHPRAGRGIIDDAMASALLAAMPLLRTAVMTNVEHNMHDDDPEIFFALVLEALQRDERRDR